MKHGQRSQAHIERVRAIRYELKLLEAVAMADVAGGVGDAQITRLYDMDEAVSAMRIAQSIDYKAPATTTDQRTS